MYSMLMLVLAGAHAAVAVAVFRRWRAGHNGLLFLVLLSLLAALWDTAVVGAGRYLGQGPLLEQLSGLRFAGMYLALPLLLFVFATLSRRAGFPWARHDWAHGAFCIAAVAILAWHFTMFDRLLQVYPACWQDTLRYVLSVNPAQACAPGQPGIGVAAPFPWAAVAIFLLFLGLGIGLAVRQGWPWLAIGIVAGIGLMNLPAELAGPVAGFAGEAICLWSVALVTAWQPVPEPQPAGS